MGGFNLIRQLVARSSPAVLKTMDCKTTTGRRNDVIKQRVPSQHGLSGYVVIMGTGSSIRVQKVFIFWAVSFFNLKIDFFSNITETHPRGAEQTECRTHERNLLQGPTRAERNRRNFGHTNGTYHGRETEIFPSFFFQFLSISFQILFKFLFKF